MPHPYHTCTHAQTDYPLLGDTGCYVDELDKNAFVFKNPDNLTLVSGEQAYTQAMVSKHVCASYGQ